MEPEVWRGCVALARHPLEDGVPQILDSRLRGNDVKRVSFRMTQDDTG